MASLNRRREILRQFGVAPFEEAQADVLARVAHLTRHQMNPGIVFARRPSTSVPIAWSCPLTRPRRRSLRKPFGPLGNHCSPNFPRS